MIRSTNVTAVQIAGNFEPLTSQKLAGTIDRPGDWASLNSQQQVSWESVKTGIQGGVAGISKRTDLQRQVDQKEARADGGNVPWGGVFMGPIVGTAIGNPIGEKNGTIPLMQGWDRAADKFVQKKSATAPIYNVLKQLNQAAQLTKAQTLMDDVFQTMSNPNRTPQDIAHALEKKAEAMKIRNAVAPQLPEKQRQVLSTVINLEEEGLQGMGAYSTVPPTQTELQLGMQKFLLGVVTNKELIDSILSQ